MLLGCLLLSPLLVAALLSGLEIPDSLRAAMVLVAASAPIFSNAAFALILGLDAALATVICVAATALVPFTMPPLALALLGVSLNIDALALGLRLAGVVGAAFFIAWAVRRWSSPGTLQRHAHALDGAAVLAALLFVLAIMDGMTALAIEQPVFVLTVTLAALLINLLLQALGLVLAWPFGARIAVTTAMIFGNCNMGLVMVALGSQADAQMQAFFAFGQLPMYILPAVMLPLYRWIVAASDARNSSRDGS
jgi:BASS family bile acid:Na+ symporter